MDLERKRKGLAEKHPDSATQKQLKNIRYATNAIQTTTQNGVAFLLSYHNESPMVDGETDPHNNGLFTRQETLELFSREKILTFEEWKVLRETFSHLSLMEFKTLINIIHPTYFFSAKKSTKEQPLFDSEEAMFWLPEKQKPTAIFMGNRGIWTQEINPDNALPVRLKI